MRRDIADKLLGSNLIQFRKRANNALEAFKILMFRFEDYNTKIELISVKFA
jgi:hypothetical protein